MNFLKAQASGDGAADRRGSEIVLPRPLAGPGGDGLTFGIRPEHISIATGGIPLGDVNVDLVEQLGGQTMLYTTTASGEPLTIAMDGQQQVSAGTPVAAYADAGQYHVFGPDGLAR